jgi:DNA replication protein DnaC
MDNNLKEMIHYIRLNHLIAHWDSILDLAQKGNYSPIRLLKYVVEKEYEVKKENARKMRMSRARIPETFMMETYPFERQPKLNKSRVLALYDSFDYISKNRNMIWMGPTGTGKTGLATAFLIQAIHKGYKGRFITFPALLELLYQSVADHTESKVLKTLTSYDCLLIDELGYVEVEPIQVGLFFTLMHRRHKKSSTLITTNLGFSQWPEFLKNHQLTAALLDRLTEDSYLIHMKDCTSLRKKLSGKLT